MSTTNNEVCFYLSEQIKSSIYSIKSNCSIEIVSLSDLTAIPLHISIKSEKLTGEQQLEELKESLFIISKELQILIQDIGYKVIVDKKWITHEQIREFNGLSANRNWINLKSLTLISTNKNIQSNLNKIKKALAIQKKNNMFVHCIQLTTPHSNVSETIDLRNKKFPKEIHSSLRTILNLNYNRLINGWDFIGDIESTYFYSKKAIKKHINIISDFCVEFDFYGQSHTFKINFSKDTPQAIVLKNGLLDVTKNFLKDPNLPPELHNVSETNLKNFVKSKFSRAVKFKTFKIAKKEVVVLVGNFAKFNAVTIVYEVDSAPRYIEINVNGIYERDGFSIDSNVKDLTNSHIHQRLLNEMKSYNRLYFKHLLLKTLSIPHYRINHVYFHL